ncbi:hypothetical protein ACET3Z_005899 [Daucus carota]
MNTMQFIKHSPITDLNTSTIKWTVRARAQAIWKGISRDTKEFRGINILLVDDSRSRIHGFIAAKLAPLFENELVEGDIYEISNFIVQDYTGLEFHRCVRFDKHIFFAQYTKMEKCTSPGLTIPKLVVDLFSLKDLQPMEEDKRFLCDVCGVLKNPQEFRDYINDNDEPKQQKKFTLTDGCSEIGVTLFDDMAKSFEEELQKSGVGTKIIILSSVKVGKFQDQIAVNQKSSRVTTTSFFHPEEVVVKQLESVPMKEMCIADIKKLDHETKVTARVIVKKIREDLNWFFYICTKCNSELDYVDGRYKCPQCNRFFPWPQKRFRVYVLCSDKTGVLPLVFGDREIRRLTGKMVFDVELDLTEEEDGKFPPLFNNFINKEYVLTIDVSEENLKLNSEVYQISDVQMDVEEKLSDLEHLDNLSEEAEDDLTIQDIELKTQSSRTAAKKKKIITTEDLPKSDEEAKRIKAKHDPLRKLKNIKIKKEKIVVREKKKSNSNSQPRSSEKKKGRKLIDVISESDDEEMTLNTYQLKNKKQVRILRHWKGVSTAGDGWKGINILLLDDKNFRMHAFVPGKVIEKDETKLSDGNLCIISNFTIKNYENSEKFRVVNHDKQIILTTYTHIEKVEEDDGFIQKNMFDFYDLGQLDDIADKNIFLTDVVGIIENDTPIADLVNRFGKKQKQVKFNIVDGRSSVNVCFWDNMAEKFNETIQNVEEHPTIIIISSAKVTSWQPQKMNAKQYELANVTATTFYINYQDESVAALRRMYARGLFGKYNFVNYVKPKYEEITVKEVKKLQMHDAEKQIICKVQIKEVLETGIWYRYHCTSCYKSVEMKNGNFKCYRCADRNVPEPDLRWEITVIAEDKTGEIHIVLFDREIRSIFNFAVTDFDDEVLQSGRVPTILKALEKQHFYIRLHIKEANILGKLNSYYANGVSVCQSAITNATEETTTPLSAVANTLTQESGPSYHLEDFSDPNIKTTEVDKRPQRKKKLTKKFSY